MANTALEQPLTPAEDIRRCILMDLPTEIRQELLSHAAYNANEFLIDVRHVALSYQVYCGINQTMRREMLFVVKDRMKELRFFIHSGGHIKLTFDRTRHGLEGVVAGLNGDKELFTTRDEVIENVYRNVGRVDLGVRNLLRYLCWLTSSLEG